MLIGKKILIVDDEQDICEILEFNLANEGFDVTCANSAEEALEKIIPDHVLILLDVNLDIIAEDDDSGEGLNAFISAELEAGIFYIVLASFAFGDGSYDLTVSSR